MPAMGRPSPSALPRLPFGDVVLDRTQRTVERKGESVHSTQIEYHLLSVLVANAGKLMPHRHLGQQGWRPNHGDRGH